MGREPPVDGAKGHGVDDDLVAFTGHEDDQFEQVAGGVGADDKPSVGVLAEVLHRQGALGGVEHVGVVDVVTAC